MGGAVYCPCSLDWGPTMVWVMVEMATFFKRTYARTLVSRRPLEAQASAGASWALTGKSGSVSCGVTAPFSWVLLHTGFVCALQESISPVLWKLCNQIPLVFKVNFLGSSEALCWIPWLGNLLWALELSQQWEDFFGIIVLLVGVQNCITAVENSTEKLSQQYGGFSEIKIELHINQQFNFYIQKNWKQDLKEIFSHPCPEYHWSQ